MKRIWLSGCRGNAAASRVALLTGDVLYRSSVMAVGGRAGHVLADIYAADPMAPLRPAPEASTVLAKAAGAYEGAAAALAAPWARFVQGSGEAQLVRLRGPLRSGYVLRLGGDRAFTLSRVSLGTPRVVTGFATSRGPRRSNEDSVLVASLRVCPQGPRLHIVLLADGAGGLSYGQMASMLGVVETHGYIARSLPEGGSLERSLLEAIRHASRRVLEEARKLGKMAASTIAAYIVDEGNRVIAYGNAGDSTVHLVREGRVEELSRLHRHAAGEGRAPLTSYLGLPEPRVETGLLRGLRGRLHLVAMSDGVHEYVEEREIAEIVASSSPGRAAWRLVSLAASRGSRDNMTAVVTLVKW